jgi:methyl-accepting chemotaxis protein
MKTMKLRSLLLLGFGLILALLTIVGGLAIISSNRLNEDITDIAERRLPMLNIYNAIDDAVQSLRTQSLVIDGMSEPSAQTTSELNTMLNERRTLWAEIDRQKTLLQTLPHTSAEGQREYSNLITSLEEYRTAYSALDNNVAQLAQASAGNNAEAFTRQLTERRTLRGAVTAALTRLSDIIDTAILRQTKESEDTAREASANASTSVAISASLTAVGLTLGALIGILIFRAVISQIGGEPDEIRAIMTRFSQGDLTMKINLNPGDTTSALASIAATVANMRSMVGEITQNASDIAAASEQLHAGAENIAAASENQSQAATSMAAAVEQVTVSINHVSDSATDANKMAQQSGSSAHEGAETIQSVVTDINRVAQEVTSAAQGVEELGNQSREIASVVNIIKEVADQTNLLALNAAIEAARAGEQGRGFAVVADEVRKLAERTATSTEDIARIVALINSGTERAVQAMRHQSESVNSTVALSERAGVTIGQINDASGAVIKAVNDISLALAEQSSASTEIAKNVERIATMSEDNSTAVRETASATADLTTRAAQLQELVNRFTI